MRTSQNTISVAHDDGALLNAAFEATATGICFVDEEGCLLRVNRAFCTMLGYTPEELAGRHWGRLIAANATADTDRLLTRLRAGSSGLAEAWPLRCRDGTLLPMRISSQPVMTAGGECRLVLTFTGIDQTPSTEQAKQRRADELYRNVLENVRIAIVVVQGDRLVYANPHALELSDYTAAQLACTSFGAILHPDDLEAVQEIYRRRIEGVPPTKRHACFRIVRRNGQVLWVESSAVRIDWEGGPAILAFLSDQSEQRSQQEALIQSEERHRQVVDNATEGIVVLQDDGVAFANSRIRELTGLTLQDMHGRPFLEVVHADDRPLLLDRYARRMRGETVAQDTVCRLLNRHTNTYTWIQISVVTIAWAGRPAALCFITDITERKALEDRLKQSLDERDTILDNSIVGMIFLNPAGRMHWANEAMFQIFDVNPTDPIGKSLEAYYPSREAYLRTGAAVAEAVRKGATYEAELQMRRGNGQVFWAYLSGRAVNPRDLSCGTVWVVMDITKRRQLEEDLNKSEEHYRQVVNNVTECIFVVQDGCIVFANPRVQQLTGYTQEELSALSFVTAVHPEDRPLVIDHHMRRLRGDQVEPYYQFRIINHLTDAIIWVQLSAVMIEWEGRPATLSFMTDITERKRLEDSLKESMAERIRLETLQIQGELKEAELARRHAEETTHAKSMFLANMSHEIRTPMNAIIGMAHLVLRTDLNTRQRDYVEKIRGAGLSLLGIINDILDFSKIEAGKLDMEHITFNLDDVLGNVAAVTGAPAHEKQLEYLFQFPLDVPRRLIGDPLRLGQVLINLVNNAVKFTERGEIHVACHPLHTGDGKIQLQFVVRDTGIGMTPEETTKLFRAFSQADESTTRKYGGTGLGLSISKRLVELMGGDIRLESEAGIGTTIHFTAWFGLAEPRYQPSTVPPALNGMRVLVVDDNANARAVLTDSLAALPLQIELACNASKALDMIRTADRGQAYGVVLTDIHMPGMSGTELIRQVKCDDKLQAPPRIVLLTAHGREDAHDPAMQVPADGFLLKPVNASALRDTLIALVAPRHTRPTRSRETTPRFKNLTILLVEDNEINQQIAVELMRTAGIAVDVASNGRAAVEQLASVEPNRYGMIFMDIQMPEMDGHEATRRIRADARFNTLPIVAMTAHAMVEERERCFAVGMNDHLAKPVDPAVLYRTIKRWCPEQLETEQATTDVAPSAVEPELHIDGVDVQDGLVRTLGNRDLYLHMLQRFRQSQSDAVARINAALPQDRVLAERLAHSLKGSAGLLGAMAVQRLSARLESGIRDGLQENALRSLLDALDASMRALHAAIGKLASGNMQESRTSSFPPAEHRQAQAVIQRFADLLRDSDGEATDMLIDSRNLLAASLDASTCARIERAVRNYDFDEALAALTVGAANAGYTIREGGTP
ncbi:MAG TPA: PAS domain S-box protein [Noviherbaspirillum sp.]|nr:PAS domain S-box protein [Noviherbaspirillum sp.]